MEKKPKLVMKRKLVSTTNSFSETEIRPVPKSIYGIGAMTTWYQADYESSTIKVCGKLSFAAAVVSTYFQFQTERFAKDSLIWIIYLLNCKEQPEQISPNPIGMSLVKITEFNNNEVLFHSFETSITDESTVLQIIPYESSSHCASNFFGNHTNKHMPEPGTEVVLKTEGAWTNNSEASMLMNSDDSMHNEDSIPNQSENFPLSHETFDSSRENISYEVAMEEHSYSKDDFALSKNQGEMPRSLDSKAKVQKIMKNKSKLNDLTSSTDLSNCIQEVLIHHEDKVFKKYECLACNKFFKNKSGITNHVKSHKGEKRFQCNICNKLFSQSNRLTVHMRIHTGQKPHECVLCKAKFISTATLFQHYRTHPEDISECPDCFKVFLSNSELIAHKETCGKTTTQTNQHDLITVKTDLTEEQDTEEKVEIDILNGSSSDPNQLQSCKLEENSYKCDVCLDTFTLKSNLRKHIASSHKMYRCNVCKISFSEMKDLKLHKLVHIREKKYHCRFCDNKYFLKGPLILHERHHTGEKPFQCSRCGKTFATHSALASHTRFHTGERPHKCQLCDHSCVTSNDLKIHMRSHTGEKPFCCHVCGKGCTTQSNLSSHMLIHFENKTHQCTTCFKYFSRKDYLKRHMDSHTGENRSVCPICETTYLRRDKLKRHVRKHHPGSEHLIATDNRRKPRMV